MWRVCDAGTIQPLSEPTLDPDYSSAKVNLPLSAITSQAPSICLASVCGLPTTNRMQKPISGKTVWVKAISSDLNWRFDQNLWFNSSRSLNLPNFPVPGFSLNTTRAHRGGATISNISEEVLRSFSKWLERDMLERETGRGFSKMYCTSTIRRILHWVLRTPSREFFIAHLFFKWFLKPSNP